MKDTDPTDTTADQLLFAQEQFGKVVASLTGWRQQLVDAGFGGEAADRIVADLWQTEQVRQQAEIQAQARTAGVDALSRIAAAAQRRQPGR